MDAILTFICFFGGSLVWIGLSINDSILIWVGGFLVVSFFLMPNRQ